MRRIANAEMRDAFLGWQCRIRQIAMREYGGQPLPGMRPRVSTRKGKSLSPGLVVLLLPVEPQESTAFFKYQVQKTNEPQKDAGRRHRLSGRRILPAAGTLLGCHGGDLPARLELAAAEILKAKRGRAGFRAVQSESYRMFCAVRRLGKKDEAREAALWQARIFKRDLANDCDVLSFTPDWTSANADPPV